MAVLSANSFGGSAAREDALHCPHDASALQPILFRSGKLHHCHRCQGSFLPGEVVSQVPRIERWFAHRRGGARGLPPGEIQCPHGHGIMLLLKLESHQLDICPDCHGIWFDAQELQRLQNPKWMQAVDNAVDNVVIESADSALDGVGELASGALELLGDIVGGIDISL